MRPISFIVIQWPCSPSVKLRSVTVVIRCLSCVAKAPTLVISLTLLQTESKLRQNHWAGGYVGPEVQLQSLPNMTQKHCGKCQHMDVVFGCECFGLHPKQEVAKYGDSVSIMSGPLRFFAKSSFRSCQRNKI